MAIALYSEKHWFPDGSDATGELAYVYPRGGPPKAPLFADLAGTVPLPNPLNIGPNGFLTFYVENGDYWVHVRGQSFYVIVDTDPDLSQVWPSTFVHNHPVAEAMWTIEHGLNSRPAVTVVLGQQIIEGDVAYLDDDTLTITFGAPTAGDAYLRR